MGSGKGVDAIAADAGAAGDSTITGELDASVAVGAGAAEPLQAAATPATARRIDMPDQPMSCIRLGKVARFTPQLYLREWRLTLLVLCNIFLTGECKR